METIGKFFTGVFLLFLSAIISGFILTKLWAWFIVSTFNQDPLRLVEAIGLGIVVSYLTTTVKYDEEEKEFSDIIVQWFFKVFYALFILLFAWVIHLFM
jgi:hypothetical protein